MITDKKKYFNFANLCILLNKLIKQTAVYIPVNLPPNTLLVYILLTSGHLINDNIEL